MEVSGDWIAAGSSVKGAKHRRIGTFNQDAVNWGWKAGNLVLAVSDGHGSSQHFRSHLGAKFAVQTAVETILREADVDGLTVEKLPKLKQRVREKLPKRLVKDWQSRVQTHYAKNPFSEPELAKAAAGNQSLVKQKLKKTPAKAYGATMLGVLITEQFILYFQLGDGDILLVTNSKVSRVFPSCPEKGLGPATNSLCMVEPEIYFNLQFQPLVKKVPDLIMVVTDGYVNSFPYDSDFFQAGKDFLTLGQKEGIKYVEDKLKNWLVTTSYKGSGDDITAGLIYNKIKF